MTKIPEEYNLGDLDTLTVQELAQEFQKMYRELSIAINARPTVIVRQANGQTNETFLPLGTININNTTSPQVVEVLTDYTNTQTVEWTTVS